MVVAAITLTATLRSTVLADGQSDKEKKEQKEKAESEAKERDAALLWGPGFSINAIAGNEGYLGVYLEEVSSDRAKELGLSEERGAIVMKVVSGSPAEKAGLKENDVILSFNGRRVDSVRELQRMLGDTPVGRTVALEVARGGSKQTISATVTKRTPVSNLYTFKGSPGDETWWRGLQGADALKQADAARKLQEQLEQSRMRIGELGNFNFIGPSRFMFHRGSRLGVAVESLTDQLGEYFGVKSGRGVLVAEVTENGPAAKAGLKAGDVITGIDGQKTESVPDLMKAISKKEEGSMVLTIVRNRQEQSITVNLEKPEPRRTLQRLLPSGRVRVIAV
jgi:serine protease Do